MNSLSCDESDQVGLGLTHSCLHLESWPQEGVLASCLSAVKHSKSRNVCYAIAPAICCVSRAPQPRRRARRSSFASWCSALVKRVRICPQNEALDDVSSGGSRWKRASRLRSSNSSAPLIGIVPSVVGDPNPPATENTRHNLVRPVRSSPPCFRAFPPPSPAEEGRVKPACTALTVACDALGGNPPIQIT